jgi:putative nucleotidyltransferase with HDIG domain
MIKLRDPVHNFVTFNEDEIKVINLDVLQRLRGIRQLAMESLVYPGALHTRFDHTLGVAHVAGQLADELGVGDAERRLVRMAALLHDIGHGPFSHVSEYGLDRYSNRKQFPKELKKEKIHEIITARLIRTHKPLLDCIGKETCDSVAQLLTSGYGDPILKSIVSGPLDADKQDYLLRDSFYCGVNYGVFDIHQLQRSLISEEVGGQMELMIRHDGIHAVEQFVLAKYYLTTMVYRHKIRLITDQMLVRAISLGIDKDENKELKRLYTFDNSDDFVRNFLSWNDSRFLLKFSDGKTSKCKEMVQRLTQRRLLKRVFYAGAKDFQGTVKEALRTITRVEQAKLRRKLEVQIAKLLKTEFKMEVDPDFTILHAYQIKSVRESSRNDEASILVNKGADKPGKFEDESVLFSSINERMSDEFVEVYAPVTWQEHAQRTKALNRISPLIKDLITTTLSPVQLKLQI